MDDSTQDAQGNTGEQATQSAGENASEVIGLRELAQRMAVQRFGPMTESERAVLCFLPSHMTNEAISEALFLSVNPVKTHLRSAYRKLGARSRREAIARGRRLGLL